jgi:EAL domain-containing protein (putative c-di-GMP-specific phosphodiesterase class I)
VHVTASFGTAIYPEDGTTVDRLLAASGAALHQAKSTGRNRVVAASGLSPHWFGAGLMLSEALRSGRVIPAYQPIVDLRSGEVVGEEALARIRTTSGKLVPASAFIEAARELQLTHQIDRAIILSALDRCASQTGRQRLKFVNISGNLLRHPDVVREMLAKARAVCAGQPASVSSAMPIVIEVTERELLADLAHARDLLRPFEDFGFRLALDDFGSGYSSYRYLADLPVSFLKIEGTLIRRIREKRVRTIVQGIQHTAVELGIATLAEYVEDAEIADIVRELGIDLGQGYYFGPPSAN